MALSILGALAGKDMEALSAAIAQGADVNRMYRTGRKDIRHQFTVLHIAAYTNNAEACRVLLEAGAQPLPAGDATCLWEAKTPQHLAADRGHIEALMVLAEFGCRFDCVANRRTMLEDVRNNLRRNSADIEQRRRNQRVLNFVLVCLGMSLQKRAALAIVDHALDTTTLPPPLQEFVRETNSPPMGARGH